MALRKSDKRSFAKIADPIPAQIDLGAATDGHRSVRASITTPLAHAPMHMFPVSARRATKVSRLRCTHVHRRMRRIVRGNLFGCVLRECMLAETLCVWVWDVDMYVWVVIMHGWIR